MFQDRNDIGWGQQWKERIEGSLNAVTFLVPIITPGFFKSPACREEFQLFLQREDKLNHNDLILPIYYVDCPILSDEAKREKDPMAKAIASRQYADWRDLRFEPFTSPDVGKTLARMARQIVEALERGEPAVLPSTSPRAPVKPKTSKAQTRISAAQPQVDISEATAEPARGPASKNEPYTRVVDALYRGDHATLTEALEAAKPGDRILVRPGLYKEGVVIDKPVEIVGDGELGEVVIESSGMNVVKFKANMGRIANLTLRQTGGGNWYCVNIGQGRLDLEACDITSQSLACVAIHGGADPRLRRNRIHDGTAGGVYIYDNGQGALEDNDILSNALAGVEIETGGNPTLRRNRIHDGKSGGVYVHENGQGTIEDNDVFANGHSGMQIKTEGNPMVRRNRIHDGKQNGVHVYENGKGTLEDNDIFANAYAGVQIRTGGKPTLRRNRISKNGYEAIWVNEGGGGVIENNDLRGNARGAWDIALDCEDKVKRKENKE
ncbi:MAG TPA: right-handed parallel beta-helix repeat-containing protein [Pyrinomonadaceae bacterium]|nr:right-handed parallel beta-helix repeat-containing protein [Pyrinomonadaceae bacterium]